MKKKSKLVHILYWIAFLTADFFVLMILGVGTMAYDDRSGGEDLIWNKMTAFDITVYVLFFLWFIVNIILIISLVCKILERDYEKVQ